MLYIDGVDTRGADVRAWDIPPAFIHLLLQACQRLFMIARLAKTRLLGTHIIPLGMSMCKARMAHTLLLQLRRGCLFTRDIFERHQVSFSLLVMDLSLQEKYKNVFPKWFALSA